MAEADSSCNMATGRSALDHFDRNDECPSAQDILMEMQSQYEGW